MEYIRLRKENQKAAARNGLGVVVIKERVSANQYFF